MNTSLTKRGQDPKPAIEAMWRRGKTVQESLGTHSFGIYISSTISGTHLNPAVTIALAATKRMPWRKVPHYILARFLGAFCSAAIVFAVYYPKWTMVDAKFDHTANVLCTFPAVPGFLAGFF